MQKAPLFSLLTDKAVLKNLQDDGTLEKLVPAGERESLLRLVEGKEGAVRPGALSLAEAIVLTKGRPALLVQNGAWEKITVQEIKTRVEAAASALKSVIPRVGRVEILDFGMDYVGTGWMLDEDVMVTNRHVADIFAEKAGSGFSFRGRPDGGLYEARIDFLREHDGKKERQFKIAEVLWVEDESPGRPDMALLRLDRSAGALPEPIELDSGPLNFRDHVAVIGYPAEDSRNDAFVMRKIFKDIYGVKRLSPGWLSGVDTWEIQHDCSTLGGNSGSAVINLATGKVCGLHFAGAFLDRNWAVRSSFLKQRLAEIGRPLVAVPADIETDEGRKRKPKKPKQPKQPKQPQEPDEPGGATGADLSKRKGYDPKFLGAGDLAVPLPELPDGQTKNLAAVTGRKDGELKYEHFSIKMRSDRRVAFFTAVNIDGNQLYNFPRAKDVWLADPRLKTRAHQTDDKLYASNSLDRGHLVRRLDPVWGETRAEGMRAMEDTFFFTNCSPQHSRLNQKTWLSLEDYVLNNAATHDLKVSVFTGAFFRDDDRAYRGVKIPEEFWKVLVIKNQFTGKLSATGYVVSQADYLGDLEFVFGEFRTYQVPVSQIEEKSGLSFGDLSDNDPLRRIEARPQRVIRGPEDMVL